MIDQAAGVSALVFAAAVVLMNIMLIVGGVPHTAGYDNRVVAAYSAHRALLTVAAALGPVAWIATSVLGAATVVAAQRANSDTELFWALLAFAGLLSQNVVSTVVVAIRLAMVGADRASAGALWPLHQTLFTLNGAFLSLALLGLTLTHHGDGGLSVHTALGMTGAGLLFVSAMPVYARWRAPELCIYTGPQLCIYRGRPVG